MKTTPLFLFALILVMVTAARCSSTPRSPNERGPALAPRLKPIDQIAFKPELFDDYLKRLGMNVYYANLHAHHYMEYQATRTSPNPPDWVGPGKCDGIGNMRADDGRPCRTGPSGQAEFVLPDSYKVNEPINKLDYFTMACDYAHNEGELDILFITPHSKNGGTESVADTTLEGFAERHAMLPEINKRFNGDFYCGLGQEASSISKGNHVNIFGQMLTTNTNETRPFFFPSGAFDRFYPQVQARRAAGEKIVLQFNHPDISGDMYWGPFADGIKKEKLNDYGIDDYAPIACLHPQGSTIDACTSESLPTSADRDILKRTFANIRKAGGDAYRLVEITATAGATTNSDFDFRRVHKRTGNARSETRIDRGLLAYIFFLDMGFKVSPTANQDNHFYNYGSAIASRTGVLAQSLAESDVIDALDNRLTFATEDKNSRLLLAARVDGKDILMGQDVRIQGNSLNLAVAYSDADNEGPVDLRVYYYHEDDPISFNPKDGPWGAVRTIQFVGEIPRLPSTTEQPMDLAGALQNGQVRKLQVPVKKGRSVLFVETTQADHDKMWSAPLFIEAE